MKEIKSLFSKFELDEAKSDEIRAKLVSKRSAGRVWLIPVIAVAAAIAIIMVIPVTRTRGGKRNLIPEKNTAMLYLIKINPSKLPE